MYISGALQLLTETIFTEALFFTEVGRLRKCFSSPGLRTLFLAQIDTRLSCRNSPVQRSNTANDVKTSIFMTCLLQKLVSSIKKTTKICSRLLDANETWMEACTQSSMFLSISFYAFGIMASGKVKLLNKGVNTCLRWFLMISQQLMCIMGIFTS